MSFPYDFLCTQNDLFIGSGKLHNIIEREIIRREKREED
jgi:hypothetical protein